MLKAHQARIRMVEAWASHDVDTWRAFVDTVRSNSLDPFRARVLDIGCGANAPVSILLHSAGADVVGIDWKVGHRWGLDISAKRYWTYAREVGLGKTARKVLGELVYDRRYYITLSRRAGIPLTEQGLDLRAMDATALTLPDASVDIVHSNATWEHIADVRRANREVSRVLKPGGLACIEIHLFPSLSGGHDLPWIVPGKTDLGDVTPWRHLRDPAWREPVFLNRLRERDYRDAFGTTPGIEIVEWRTEYTEGAAFLTDAIRAELPHYSPEELTQRSIIVVLRRSA